MTNEEPEGYGARHGRIGPAGRHRRAFDQGDPPEDTPQDEPIAASSLAEAEGDGVETEEAELDVSGARPSPSPAASPLVFLRDIVVVMAIAVLLSIGVKTFLVRPYYIPSASMNETLLVEDRVLVNVLPVEWTGLSRGDVVVFRDPGGWLPPQQLPPKPPARAIIDGTLETIGLKPEESSDDLIKRVIGLPGDRVACCSPYGQIVINDVPVTEPYVQMSGHPAASGITFDVVVPAGHVWVMGDHRYNSEDSRFHQDLPTRGFVPISNIEGRAFLINWPLNRLQWLGNYPEVFAAVPNREPGA